MGSLAAIATIDSLRVVGARQRTVNAMRPEARGIVCMAQLTSKTMHKANTVDLGNCIEAEA